MSKLYSAEGYIVYPVKWKVYADSEDEAIELIEEEQWYSQDVDDIQGWVDPDIEITGVEDRDDQRISC